MNRNGLWLASAAAALGLALRAHLDLGDLLPRTVEVVACLLGVLLAWRWFGATPVPNSADAEAGPELRAGLLMLGLTLGWATAVAEPLPITAAGLCAVALLVAMRRRPGLADRLHALAGLLGALWILRLGLDGFALWRLPTESLGVAAGGLLTLLGEASGSTGQGFVFDTVRASRGTLITPELLGWPVLGSAVVLMAFSAFRLRRDRAQVFHVARIGLSLLILGMAARVLLLVLVSSYLDGQMEYSEADTNMAPFLGWKTTAAIDTLAVLAAAWTQRGPLSRLLEPPTHEGSAPVRRRVPWAPLGAFGGLLLAFPAIADTMGSPREARILVDEGHSEWEPTDLQLGTEVYGEESGYNFRALIDWLEEGYGPIRRNYETIDGQLLADFEILMIKTPTRKYSEPERSAILEFVSRGGGLMLIGDHTNVFGTGEVLNEFGADLGFKLDFDSVFDQRQTFEHVYRRPSGLRHHPILAAVPKMRFEVGCSIELGSPAWRPVIVGRGLKNLQIDYKASNFYPAVVDSTDMRFGQLVEFATRAYGRGRVTLLSDSTLLSTFSVMHPGRRELIERSMDWLSRRDPGSTSRNVARLIGIVLLTISAGCALGAGPLALSWVLLGALGAGSAAGQLAERGLYRQRPPLESRTVSKNVAFLTSSDSAFWPIEEFVRNYEISFSIFFQWVLRVGAYPRMEENVADALRRASIVVTIDPSQDLMPSVDRLIEHVESGGVVFAFQSAHNPVVAELARRGGLELDNQAFSADQVSSAYGPIDLGGPLAGLQPVLGGQPMLVALDDATGIQTPVLAVTDVGSGKLVIGSHANLITDHAYGRRYHSLPDQRRRRLFELQYQMFSAALTETRVTEVQP